MSRYATFVAKLKAAVTESSGFTTTALRKALVEERSADIPEGMLSYVDKVKRHAFRVTDADVDALKSRGLSEDEIFEITSGASLGAALHRLDRGMTALRGKRV